VLSEGESGTVVDGEEGVVPKFVGGKKRNQGKGKSRGLVNKMQKKHG